MSDYNSSVKLNCKKNLYFNINFSPKFTEAFRKFGLD